MTTEQYIQERDEQIKKNMADRDWRVNRERFIPEVIRTRQIKMNRWAGVPILQYSGDMQVLQEIIFDIKPTVIIETGIAMGGSTVFYASMLELLGGGVVISIDVDIREHTKKTIADCWWNDRITTIERSSVDELTLQDVKLCLKKLGKPTVMVCLDSNHTHEHVLRELELYSPFVSVGSYLVVFDGDIEFSGLDWSDRPWGKGNNPYSATMEFLKTHDEFVIDKEVEERAFISANPNGYLRRIR